MDNYIPQSTNEELARMYGFAPMALEGEEADKYGRTLSGRRIIKGKRLLQILNDSEPKSKDFGEDFILDELNHCPPGSPERIENLRKFYEQNPDKSAFNVNEFEALERRATTKLTSPQTSRQLGQFLALIMAGLTDDEREDIMNEVHEKNRPISIQFERKKDDE